MTKTKYIVSRDAVRGRDAVCEAFDTYDDALSEYCELKKQKHIPVDAIFLIEVASDGKSDVLERWIPSN